MFAILCSVSRSRACGKSVVALGKELGIDQRSMFHYIKAAVNIGAVKKFRTTDQGSWTNHIVHVKYLDQSSQWQAHIAAEPDHNQQTTINLNQDDHDDAQLEDEQCGGRTEQYSVLLNSTHLHSNPSLIRRRILAAFAEADHHTLAHSQVGNKIGLLYFATKDQRKFNGIIREMIDQGLLERVLIEKNQTGQRLTGLRLIVQLVNDSLVTSTEEDGEADQDLLHAQLMVPLERQIIDLLGSADADGLTNRHIGHAIGAYGPRAVDQTLVRLTRDKTPSGLNDLGVRSMTETIGREKRTRWFTSVGHNRRCARDGVQLEIEFSSRTGHWPEPELNFTEFDSNSQLDLSLGWYNLKSQLPSTSAWKAPKVSTQIGQTQPKAKSDKPIGRPRKNPLPPGKITYYERRKRQLAEQALLEQPNLGQSQAPAPAPMQPKRKPTKTKPSTPKTPKPKSPAPTETPAPIPTVDSSSGLGAGLATAPELALTQVAAAADEAPGLSDPSSKGSPKMTLTLMSRQKDVIKFIMSEGGIIENLYRLNETLRSFLDQFGTTDKVYTMDRQVLNQVIKSLVSSGQCRMTVISTGDLSRVEVISLSWIDPAGPEMSAWLGALETKPRPLRGLQRSIGDRTLVLAEDEALAPASSIPSGTDSLDVVSEFFRRSDKVMGYWRGCLPGRFSRARVLHHHLVKLAWAVKDSDLNGLGVVSHVDVIQKMTVKDWLSIIMVNDDDSNLDRFLSQDSNLELRLEQVPAAVAQLIRNRRRRQELVHLIDLLAQLLLVQPTNPQTKLSQASSWQLTKLGPIYSFNQPIHSLVNVVPVQTSDQVDAFWDQLHANSIPTKAEHELAITTSAFPQQFNQKQSLVSGLTDASKWQHGYILSSDQRKYLASLAKLDRDQTFSDEFILQLELSIFAPSAPIKAYLSEQQARATSPKMPRKAYKRARRTAAQSATELLIPIESRTEEGSISLRRKAQDATAQRQRDFTAIFQRFRQDHANPILDSNGVDYLEGVFVGTRRTGKAHQLDSNSLERELLMLLPNAVQQSSIVPKSIVSRSSSSYSLPKVFTLPPRAPRRDKGVRRPTKPTISSGTQLDFLSATPHSVPPIITGLRVRLSRHYFSKEQEDLLLDAGAVLKVKAKLGDQRPRFGSLELLFPGIGSAKLRQTLVRLIARPEHELYYSRLEQAWFQLCQSPKLRQVLASTDFDLAGHVRLLRSEVDKHALRLGGSVKQQEPDLITISADYNQIKSDYLIESISAPIDHSVAYWRPSPSFATREYDAANLAFSLGSLSLEPEPTKEVDHARFVRRRAVGALKIVLVTDEDGYDQSRAHTLLRPYVDQLEAIVQDMLHNNLMLKVIPDPTRRTPGRNFVLTDKFMAGFDHNLETNKLVSARQAFTNDSVPAEWPIVCQAGATLGLVDQVSSSSIKLHLDPELSTRPRDPDDYQTRKADDEVIECVVKLDKQPESTTPLRQSPLEPPTPWPANLANDHQYQTRREGKRSTYPARLIDELEQAGPAGLSVQQVNLWSTNDQLSALLRSKLGFWAGFNQPTFVGFQFIEWWAVEVGRGVDDRVLVLPAVWIGLNGVVVDWMWQKARDLVLATLISWPGSTWVRYQAVTFVLG